MFIPSYQSLKDYHSKMFYLWLSKVGQISATLHLFSLTCLNFSLFLVNYDSSFLKVCFIETLFPFFRIEDRVNKQESKNAADKRLNIVNPDFVALLGAIRKEKMEEILKEMQHYAIERNWLLSLKKRYFGWYFSIVLSWRIIGEFWLPW